MPRKDARLRSATVALHRREGGETMLLLTVDAEKNDDTNSTHDQDIRVDSRRAVVWRGRRARHHRPSRREFRGRPRRSRGATSVFRSGEARARPSLRQEFRSRPSASRHRARPGAGDQGLALGQFGGLPPARGLRFHQASHHVAGFAHARRARDLAIDDGDVRGHERHRPRGSRSLRLDGCAGASAGFAQVQHGRQQLHRGAAARLRQTAAHPGPTRNLSQDSRQ